MNNGYTSVKTTATKHIFYYFEVDSWLETRPAVTAAISVIPGKNALGGFGPAGLQSPTSHCD